MRALQNRQSISRHRRIASRFQPVSLALDYLTMRQVLKFTALAPVRARVFKRYCGPLVLAVTAVMLLEGCPRSPDSETVTPAAEAERAELPVIERYRTAVELVTASQKALALETAGINDENWSSVAKSSLGKANELQASIESLMEFEEAVSAAAVLRLHVASMQRQLQGIDADNLQSVLPDLLLLNESIQSDMDELMDLAAPGPDDTPAHDHDHA